jgi:hypothetical protein
MTESFENLVVDLNQLPQLQEEDFSGIELSYRKATLLSWGIFFLLLLIGGLIGIYLGDDQADRPQAYLIFSGAIILLWALNLIWGQ